MEIKANSIVRPVYPTNHKMHNEYYRLLEVIDKDALVRDAVVDPYLAEEMVTSKFLEDHSNDIYFNIVEAFDKIWVFVGQYGEEVSTVHINKDGTVWGSGSSLPSPELDKSTYYAGDEVLYVGETDKFDSDQLWLRNSVEIDCKTKCFAISKETLNQFLAERLDYLLEQAKKA